MRESSLASTHGVMCSISFPLSVPNLQDMMKDIVPCMLTANTSECCDKIILVV